MSNKDRTARLLIGLGVLLFFLGLLTGFAIPALTNPRMGVSGHLEGVMNGTFLIAIGCAWSRIHLSPPLQTFTFWALIYGTFANWAFVTVAAAFGTNSMTPIAGAGQSGLAWQETLVTVGLYSVGIAMLIAGGLLVWGFLCKAEDSD